MDDISYSTSDCFCVVNCVEADPDPIKVNANISRSVLLLNGFGDIYTPAATASVTGDSITFTKHIS